MSASEFCYSKYCKCKLKNDGACVHTLHAMPYITSYRIAAVNSSIVLLGHYINALQVFRNLAFCCKSSIPKDA